MPPPTNVCEVDKREARNIGYIRSRLNFNEVNAIKFYLTVTTALCYKLRYPRKFFIKTVFENNDAAEQLVYGGDCCIALWV